MISIRKQPVETMNMFSHWCVHDFCFCIFTLKFELLQMNLLYCYVLFQSHLMHVACCYFLVTRISILC